MLAAGDSLETNRYLHRESDLSAMVMFYSMNDEFVNGWQYSNGTIIAKLEIREQQPEQPAQIQGVQKAMHRFVTVTTCVRIYGSVEYYGKELEVDLGLYCKTSIVYRTGYEDRSSGGEGGAVNIGGVGGNPNSGTTSIPVPTVGVRADCPPSAAQHASSINATLNSYMASTSVAGAAYNVRLFMDELRLIAGTSNFESAGSIGYDNTGGNFTHYMHNQSQTAGVREYRTSDNSHTGVSVTRMDNTVLIVHTHPEGTLKSPSPLDAIYLFYAYNNNSSDIYGNVVFACDGSEYAVYVNDRNAFAYFCGHAPDGFFETDAGDNGFKRGTEWYNDYKTVYDNLIAQHYSQDDANSYALAYVLNKYNTGLKISERKNKNPGFKEQDTEESTPERPNYKPSKCP